MNSRKRRAFTGLVLLFIGALLIACSSNLKIGWREANSLKRKRAHYVTFDGELSKTFRAETGEVIELTCDVTVEKGTLNMRIVTPDGERLWEETFDESDEVSATVTAPDDGLYTLRIAGDKTGGGFDITWNVGE
ncbi:MAG: hypothetical protein ACP5HM_04255 [Anaerolineae bacterium]